MPDRSRRPARVGAGALGGAFGARDLYKATARKMALPRLELGSVPSCRGSSWEYFLCGCEGCSRASAPLSKASRLATCRAGCFFSSTGPPCSSAAAPGGSYRRAHVPKDRALRLADDAACRARRRLGVLALIANGQREVLAPVQQIGLLGVQVLSVKATHPDSQVDVRMKNFSTFSFLERI